MSGPPARPPSWWGSLQATTVLGAVRRGLRVARPDPEQPRGADPLPWPGPVPPAVPPSNGGGPRIAAAVRARALAAGAPESTAQGLVEHWPSLAPAVRRQVTAPLRPAAPATHVRFGADVAVQADRTACGSAVLTALAAAGDPLLALWLVTGETVDGYRPPEVRALYATRPGVLPDTPHERFGAVQLAVKDVSNRAAFGPFAWPAQFGTPPWGAAQAARFCGVRYRDELVDDADSVRWSVQFRRVSGALAAGFPVPLYTGGDLSGGLAAAVPRHVVLLVDEPSPGRYTVYEPSSGRLGTVTATELRAPRGPHTMLGGWTHTSWIVLPRA